MHRRRKAHRHYYATNLGVRKYMTRNKESKWQKHNRDKVGPARGPWDDGGDELEVEVFCLVEGRRQMDLHEMHWKGEVGYVWVALLFHMMMMMGLDVFWIMNSHDADEKGSGYDCRQVSAQVGRTKKSNRASKYYKHARIEMACNLL